MHRHLADAGQTDTLESDRDRIEQAEEQAGEQGRPGPPIGEDHRGERDEALAGGHLRQEAGRLRDGEIGAAQPAERAADDHRGIAQAGNRDAGGVDRSRVFADGAQAQAEARVLQRQRRQDEGEHGEIDRRGMAGDGDVVDRAEDRNLLQRADERQVELGEAGCPFEIRRTAALAVPGIAEDGGEADRQHVDRDAGNDLVAAPGDRGKAVHQRQGDRRQHAGAQAGPGRATVIGDDGRGEGGDQHLAFETDVDDARALRPEPRERGAEQRDRQADGRIEDDGERLDDLHRHSLPVIASAAKQSRGA